MVERNVVWTKTTDIQLVGILKYLVERNKSSTYSKNLVQLVNERTKQIAQHPFMFKPTDFKDIRVASLGNFSIFYKVTDDQIIISAFWDNRQDSQKLLKILQNK